MPKFTIEVKSVRLDDFGNIVIQTQDMPVPVYKRVKIGEDEFGPILEWQPTDETEDKYHEVHIHPETIGSRMVMYNLETPEEAVDAILREVGCDKCSEITLPTEKTAAEHHGGLHEEVIIEKDPTAETHLSKFLKIHSRKIQETRNTRLSILKNHR